MAERQMNRTLYTNENLPVRNACLGVMLRIAGVCVAMMLPVFKTQGEDWPSFRGPQANGISTETIDLELWKSEKTRTLWSAEVGTGFSRVVVADGRAITVGNRQQEDEVHCFDVRSGESVWVFKYEAPLEDRDFEGGSTATPTIDGNRVYVFAREGDLICLDFASGKKVWHQQIVDLADVRIPGWGFGGSPLVYGDLLLLTAGESGVAVNKHTGKLIWASADKEAGYATPVIYENGERPLALFPSGRSFSAVDPASGQQVWQTRWLTTFGCNAACPLVENGRVFLCSGYNRGCTLLQIKAGEVETVWKHKLLQNQLHTSLLIGGFVYGIHGDMEAGAELVCMKLADGEIAWTAEGITPAAITAAGKTLLAMDAQGDIRFIAAEPSKFESLGKIKVFNEEKCWTNPTFSGGKLFCRSVSGQVKCLAPSK